MREEEGCEDCRKKARVVSGHAEDWAGRRRAEEGRERAPVAAGQRENRAEYKEKTREVKREGACEEA